MKIYKLYDNLNSKQYIKELGKLPFIYKGDMNILTKQRDKIINRCPKFENFINNYFIENKFPFFKDNSLNYEIIPKD